MQRAKKLGLMTMPKLRDEIAFGPRTRLSTKVRVTVGYAREIVKNIYAQEFEMAAQNAQKLAGILRCWEIQRRSELLASLKSSAVETAVTPEVI